MQLMIATGNAGKLREINAILQGFPDLQIDLHSIKELNVEEPDEPHDTFMLNAQYKAKYYALSCGMPTLSEDAGLCINALNDFPGVRTKEFVEECGGLDNAFAELQQKLQSKNDMRAYFVCAATIYLPDLDKFISFQAQDHGQLSFPPRGTDCFGFDPVYIPNGYTQTMAELGMQLKNTISHRYLAIKGLMQQFQELLVSARNI